MFLQSHASRSRRGPEPRGNSGSTFKASELLRWKMAIYTKHGQRIPNESAHIDQSCYFADKVIKIRAVPETRRKEQVYWVKDLLADNGRKEIAAFIATLRHK